MSEVNIAFIHPLHFSIDASVNGGPFWIRCVKWSSELDAVINKMESCQLALCDLSSFPMAITGFKFDNLLVLDYERSRISGEYVDLLIAFGAEFEPYFLKIAEPFLLHETANPIEIPGVT